MLAQKHEAIFVRLWDQLRAASDKTAVLKSLRFDALLVGRKEGTTKFDWGTFQTTFVPAENEKSLSWSHATWQRFVDTFANETGLRIVQSEWHHATFHPATETRPAQSVVSMTIHLAHPNRRHRLVVSGDLKIEWSDRAAANGEPVIRTIDASNIRLLEREAEPLFENILLVKPDPASRGDGVDAQPLVVHDLDGDGRPDVILAGSNLVLRNRGRFSFEQHPLFSHPLKIRNSGCVADFDGDGHDDFLGVDSGGTGVLWSGDASGRFLGEARKCWSPICKGSSAITAGDVDADGDLDVWLTQYKPPYRDGQMPTPFFDASDGYPSYLLLNDGNGNFRDATEAAGLIAKRHRRTYSASLVDLDDDDDLDLMVVSDFAGLDLYENDGRGRFTPATEKWVRHRHAFGMSHTLGDFNGDGRQDFYMAGMSSTTARRLDRLGLKRDGFARHAAMRAPMTYGNRMYLAGDGRFVKPAMNDAVARAGWSWGCSAFDFDNDADDDLYVANGHISGVSARDYCTRFWCHDVYTGSSQPDKKIEELFGNLYQPREFRGLNEGQISWNGYEHNKLYMNLAGKDFLEVGHPMGAAFEEDSRCVVTTDLDGDGRVDLLLVVNKWVRGKRGVKAQQSLLVLRNQLKTDNHWIGIRLRSIRPGVSPIGAKVIVKLAGRSREKHVVTGDSYYSQSPAQLHFGLGKRTAVDEIIVRWPGGIQQRIKRPAIDRYHDIVLKPRP